ncbi:putative tail related protein [Erwinia phage Snitter]|nr:putative tail related protein [Erwinia phage Snitter]
MHLPNGAQIFIDTLRDEDPILATTATNAVTPVFTSADNDVAVGDILFITQSGWSKLQNRVVRVTARTETDFTVEGVNTSNLLLFPAGVVATTFIKITGWTETPCVLEVAIDGGEQQYYNYQCLASENEEQLPTFKSATTITYTLGDDFESPTYPIFEEADETGDLHVFRMIVPKAKEVRYWVASVAFNNAPNTVVNEAESVNLALALKGKFTRLAVATA